MTFILLLSLTYMQHKRYTAQTHNYSYHGVNVMPDIQQWYYKGVCVCVCQTKTVNTFGPGVPHIICLSHGAKVWQLE